MTDNSQTPTRNFIRGGQVLLHNYRMLKQLFDRILVFVFIVFIVVTIGVIKYRLNGFHVFAVKHWSVAQVATFFNENAKQKMILPNEYGNGVEIKIVPSALVLKDYRVKKALKEVWQITIYSTFYGVLGSLLSLVLIYIYLRRRGKKQSEEKKIRGYEVVTAKVTKKLVKKAGASDIEIGDIPMPKGFETGHVLIHGTTGMGKTVCIKELLDQIRARGDKAIIYDQGGDYIGSFHNKGDIILNPLDERTASWDLWKECRYSADYDSLAAALIPNSSEHSDQFWNNASRLAFSTAAKELQDKGNRSIHELLQILLTYDIESMEKFFRDTEAASLFSRKIDKTSLSIRATLATYLKGLKYVKEKGKTFSIRDWIQDDDDKNNEKKEEGNKEDSKKSWLFISSRADSHETLKPLISMWLDLVANSLMSLTPSNDRRIWLIFDELASLHKLPYLPNAFAQSRKFGGCIVAGIQSIAQLRKVYGLNAADEISTMCNTRIFFRAPSSEAAVWTSKEIGQYEAEEMKEGISYSESAMRSGISIAKQRVQQDLVSSAEIMSLNALEAYMRLPGKFPITKVKLKYKKRKTPKEAFIPRIIVEKENVENNNNGQGNNNEDEFDKEQLSLVSDDIEIDKHTRGCKKQQKDLEIDEGRGM